MSSVVIGSFDVADFSGEGLDIIGTEDADILLGTNDGELIDGLAGDDSLSASDGDDFLVGGDGADTIGGGAGNDTILGNAEADLIFAYDGDDLVNAGGGNDIIYSGEGADTLFGGAGQDSFVFDIADFEDGSVDILADFELGEDKVFIQGIGDDQEVAFDTANSSILVDGEQIVSFAEGEMPKKGEDFELM